MKSVLLIITSLILLVLNISLVVAIIWNIQHSVIDENIGGTKTRGKCTTPECLTVSSTLLKSINQSVDPCDNFYEFVCAGFRANTFVPNDEEYVTNTFTTSALMEIKFNELLNEPSADDDPNYFKNMKTYYRACRNKVVIESEAVENLLGILKKLGGWPILEGDNWNETEFDWMETILRARKLGLPYDIYLNLVPEYQRIHIRRGRGNESYYGLQYYFSFLLNIAKALGAAIEDAAVMKQINDTYQFDRDSSPLGTYRGDFDIRNVTLQQLENSSFPWIKYMENLLSPEIDINSDLAISYELDEIDESRVKLIPKLERLFANTSKRVLANGLMWQIIQWTAPYMNEEIFLKQLSFNSLDGTATELRPRWKECVSSVVTQFKVGTMAIYTKKFLMSDIRPKINEIIRYINENIKKRSAEKISKFAQFAAALKHVEDAEFYIGFPDQILNESEVESYYEDLELVGDNYLNSAMDLNIFNEKRKYLSFSDRKFDWVEFVSIFDDHVGLRPEILMTPVHLYNLMYFQKSIPEYINFGFLEKIIKPLYKLNVDSVNNEHPIWCDNNYHRYYPESYVLDGTYLAYLKFVESSTDEILPGFENFTNSQMFFISHGASTCVKRRVNFQLVDEANEHFVNVAVRNSKYFTDIFKCPKGSRMEPRVLVEKPCDEDEFRPDICCMMFLWETKCCLRAKR